MNLSSCTK